MQHRCGPVTEDRAISELGRRSQQKASMAVLNLLIRLVLICVSAAAHADEFACALESPKVVVIVALL